MIRVSGLPLDAALARLREAGCENIRVEITRGRREREDGELRALRFRGDVLLAARFPVPIKVPEEDAT